MDAAAAVFFLISLVAFEESASILFFNVWLLPDMECPHE